MDNKDDSKEDSLFSLKNSKDDSINDSDDNINVDDSTFTIGKSDDENENRKKHNFNVIDKI